MSYAYSIGTPYAAPRRAYRGNPAPAGSQPSGMVSRYAAQRVVPARRYSALPQVYAGSYPSQSYPVIQGRHPYYAAQGNVASVAYQPMGINQYVNAPVHARSSVQRSVAAAPSYGVQFSSYTGPQISYTTVNQPAPVATSYGVQATGGGSNMAQQYAANFAAGTLGTQVNQTYDMGGAEGGGYLAQKMQAYQQSGGQQQQQYYQQQDYSQQQSFSQAPQGGGAAGYQAQAYQQAAARGGGGGGGFVADEPAGAPHLSWAEKDKKAREVFRKYDKDGNNMMDIYEFLQAMGNLGTRLDFEEAQGIFQSFDESQQGCITIDQFAQNFCANY